MSPVALGWDVSLARAAPRRGRLAVLSGSSTTRDATSGTSGFNGFGVETDDTFYEDSKRTLAAIVKWQTTKATGAACLCLTSATPGNPSGDTIGSRLLEALEELGHTVTVTGNETNFGSYDPLDFNVTLAQGGLSAFTYHGLSGEEERWDYVLSNGGCVLASNPGYASDWQRYGIDEGGTHQVRGIEPYVHGSASGPPLWRYQTPFTSSRLGVLASGGSWNTTLYALSLYTNVKLALGTNTKGGGVEILDCALSSHDVGGQGVLGLWWSA